MMRKVITMLIVTVMFLSGIVLAIEENNEDWLMFNHDPARTGYTTNEAAPPFLTRIAYHATDSVRSSIAITDRYAVVGSHDNNIYCYDTRSFRIRWKLLTGDDVQSSPSIFGDVVVCGSDDGNLYCVNLRQSKTELDSSDTVWTFETGDKIRSSPLIVNNRVYVGSYDMTLYCIDLFTGKQLWGRKLGGSIEASPTYYAEEDLIIIGTQPSGMYAFKADTGQPAWNEPFATEAAVFCSASIKDGRIFFGDNDGNIYCIDADNGREIWREKFGAHIWATPALVENMVIVCTYNGVKCYYQDDGSEVWPFPASDNWIYSSPAVGGDNVYFGSDDHHLYCLKWRTGELVWKGDLGDVVQASPVIFDDAVYIGTWGGTVQVFHPGPVLGVKPSEVDFGVVELGTTPTRDITIMNVRNDEFESELDGELSCEDEHLSLNPTDFMGISNNSERRIRIKLDPSGMEYGNHQALIKVTSNGGDANIIVRWKVITPAPACMTVNPTEIDFGYVERGGEKSQIIQLSFDTDTEVSGMVMGEDRWIDVEPITFTSVGKRAMLKITVNASRVPAGTEAMGRLMISTQNEVCQQVSVGVKIATEPKIEITMTIGDPIAFVNYRPIELDVAPYISDKGRTLVPLRFVSETFGAKVQWIGEEKKIIIERFDKTIIMWVGKTEYEVDGILRSLDTPPEITNGRTMVPFRAIAEAIGADVSWDGETRTVRMIFMP
jgi:eukaryotic-like serine/threonine-protein kinase